MAEPIKTIIQVLDPTGITSWGDAKDAIKEAGDNPSFKSISNAGLEVLGALPMIGKVGKVGKAKRVISSLLDGIPYINKVARPVERITSTTLSPVVTKYVAKNNLRTVNTVIPAVNVGNTVADIRGFWNKQPVKEFTFNSENNKDLQKDYVGLHDSYSGHDPYKGLNDTAAIMKDQLIHIENKDSVGFNKKERKWYPPKATNSKGKMIFDSNQVLFGLDHSKTGGIRRYIERQNRLKNPYVTEVEGDSLQNRIINQHLKAINYNISGLTKEQLAMLGGIRYHKGNVVNILNGTDKDGEKLHAALQGNSFKQTLDGLLDYYDTFQNGAFKERRNRLKHFWTEYARKYNPDEHK